MLVAIAFKITVFRFMNASAILLLKNTEVDQWFVSGELITQLDNYMTLAAVETPIFFLLQFPSAWFKCCKACK
jgi:hypothetical protein